jgi:hypothetical protein
MSVNPPGAVYTLDTLNWGAHGGRHYTGTIRWHEGTQQRDGFAPRGVAFGA